MTFIMSLSPYLISSKTYTAYLRPIQFTFDIMEFIFDQMEYTLDNLEITLHNITVLSTHGPNLAYCDIYLNKLVNL